MAATGFTPISLYYSTTASTAPTAGNLIAGELAINTTDGKLYYKDTAGVVQTLATKDATSGSFVNLAYTGTLTGGTGVVNLGSGQFYKDASGNVILGGTTQNGKLTVKNPSSSGEQVMFAIQNASNTSSIARITYSQTDDSLRFANMSSFAGSSLRFGNNGLDQVTIDLAGNVGIGTSSPATKLNIKPASYANGTAVAPAFQIEYSGAAGSSSTSQGAICWSSAGVQTGAITTAFDNPSATYNTAMIFYTSNSTGTNTERMRISSGGDLLIGTTATSVQKLRIDGTQGGIFVTNDDLNHYSYLALSKSSSSAAHYVLGILNSAGTTVGAITHNNTTTTYATSSDYRLKENIAPMTGALDVVQALKPVTYKWKSDGSDGQGFIAHELQKVVPDCVTGEKDAMRTEKYEISPAIPAEVDEDGKVIKEAVEAVMGEREVPAYQGIDTSFLVATLTAAIQELNAKVTTLEEQVLTLSVK